MDALIDLLLQEKEIHNVISDLRAGQDRQLLTGLSGGAKAVFFKAVHTINRAADSTCHREHVASPTYIRRSREDA